MKVFISWSGEKSKAVALALRKWLPQLINAIEPWMSDEDIATGSVSMAAIAKALQGSSFGIIIITPENFERPWVNFEAGAISKQVGDLEARVAPLLIGYERKGDLPKSPLSNYQVTMPTKEDMKKLLLSLNAHAGEGARKEDELFAALDLWWPMLDDQLVAIQAADPSVAVGRPDREVLDELLGIVRGLQRQIGEITPEAPTSIRAKALYSRKELQVAVMREAGALLDVYALHPSNLVPEARDPRDNTRRVDFLLTLPTASPPDEFLQEIHKLSKVYRVTILLTDSEGRPLNTVDIPD